MRKLIILTLLLHQVWTQSVNASLTIYKDGFGLVKQPVTWIVNAGKNTIYYDRITDGLFIDSPFLNLKNAAVISQRLNRNIFSSGSFFQNKLGEKVEIKLSGDKVVSGTLVEYSGSQIAITGILESTVKKGEKLENSFVKQSWRLDSVEVIY